MSENNEATELEVDVDRLAEILAKALSKSNEGRMMIALVMAKMNSDHEEKRRAKMESLLNTILLARHGGELTISREEMDALDGVGVALNIERGEAGLNVTVRRLSKEETAELQA